jgi:chaperonin GroEL (HSP60 family)
MAIANIVRTSLGPLGLDKMLVDDIGVNIFFLINLLKLKINLI